MALLDSLQGLFAEVSCNLALTNDLFSNLTRNVAFGFDQNAINRYRRNQQALWCNDNPYTEPFRPGECPILYNVTITYQITSHPVAQFNGTFEVFGQFYGPIGAASYLRVEADAPGARQIHRITLASHGGFGGARQEQWVITQFPNGEFHEQARLVILNVQSVPADPGGVTTCGEYLDPTEYNPDAHTYRRDVTYTTNNNTSVTVPLVLVVGQFKVDANLNLKVPINVKIDPTFNFKTTIPLDIDLEYNWNTGDTEIDWVGADDVEPPPLPPAAAPSPPGTSPNNPPPPVPDDVPQPEPDPNDPDNDRVIIGAIVTSIVEDAPSGSTQIFQTDNPDIYIPSLGYVNFASRRDVAGFGWTADIAVKNLRQYVPCPIPEGASEVAGTPKTGVNWTITPVYSNYEVLGVGA